MGGTAKGMVRCVHTDKVHDLCLQKLLKDFSLLLLDLGSNGKYALLFSLKVYLKL